MYNLQIKIFSILQLPVYNLSQALQSSFQEKKTFNRLEKVLKPKYFQSEDLLFKLIS